MNLFFGGAFDGVYFGNIFHNIFGGLVYFIGIAVNDDLNHISELNNYCGNHAKFITTKKRVIVDFIIFILI